MTEPLRHRLITLLRTGRLGPLNRLLAFDREQWQALAAYRGLVQQAFVGRPFQPQVCSDLWDQGGFREATALRPFFNPAHRERENSSHHYGHDIQIKRHAGLPLIGPPLPWLLEHGLKVSRDATFEAPRSWARGYLCMGPLRARWLRERFDRPAHAIGPWIAYARPLLTPDALAELRRELGPTLLVVLAHSWDQVERRMDLQACLEAVTQQVRDGGYRSVLWLRHWKDPVLPSLPPGWIVACNGHRSNPWFLDALRTLLALSDGLSTNAFGTHLGYAAWMERRLHWLPVAAEQDLSQLGGAKAEEEAIEWAERQRLSALLVALLDSGDAEGVRQLLDLYWGLNRVRAPQELRRLLRGRGHQGPGDASAASGPSPW